jgi:hypothetical protein
MIQARQSPCKRLGCIIAVNMGGVVMASEVDICNLALAHLGDEATVTSIDPAEDSAQAEHCQRFYPIARNTVLEAHPWSFAKKRVSLVSLTDEPPGAWAYIYQYPTSCLVPLKLLGPDGSDDDDTKDYVVEVQSDGNKVIYTNIEDAVLMYTALISDTTKYTTLFVNAVARLLASYLSGPIIKGKAGIEIGASQFKIFWDIELPLAKRNDANAQKKQAGNNYDNFVPAGRAARL